MQKNIILIILAIILISGGVWLFSAKDSPSTQDASTNTAPEQMEANQAEENISGLGSFGSIMGLGDNVRCEFKSSYDGQTSEGTFFTDGERFRLESVSEDPASGKTNINIINNGTHSYVWGTSPDGDMAMKLSSSDVSIDTEDPSNGQPMSKEGTYVDLDEKVEYDCSRWRVDASIFVAPSDIEFMDMESMMREAMQDMPEDFEMPEGMPTY